MEDVLVRELPPKSSVDINDYIVMEDYDGTKIAKLEDIKTAIASHLYFNSLDDVLEASLNEGDVCIALGRYEMNDGGFGIYKIVNNPALIEDKVLTFYLNTSDTLRAVLIHNGTINVHQAGAYGDGVHDDVDAIHRALRTKLNVIFGHEETYLCSDVISITNDLHDISKPVEVFDQIVDFDGSTIYRTTTGNGILIKTRYEDSSTEYTIKLNPGSITVKNLGGVDFADDCVGKDYVRVNGDNITLKNINIEIKNPKNDLNERIGLLVMPSNNIYVDGLKVTRIINDDTERYTYNEYVSYLLGMNFSGKDLFTVLEGNVPDYNNGKVLKMQTGTGISIFTSSTDSMNNIVFNNITLNNLSKGVAIQARSSYMNNFKFSNISINGTELSEFQGRMIESIEATGDDEFPYNITYHTLTTKQQEVMDKRKDTKVFISKYTDYNRLPVDSVSCGFYLDNFTERNVIDIENLYVSNVADCFYTKENSSNINDNTINITNFVYYNDTLKNIGGASTDADYIYNEKGMRDSFSVIYNYEAVNGNMINLYGTHRYGGNNSDYEYKLPTAYIFGLASKVNNYGIIKTYGDDNCNTNIFVDDKLNGPSVIDTLPIICESPSLSKQCKEISNRSIVCEYPDGSGHIYSDGGFIDLSPLDPSGDTNIYYTSNVNMPIRFIGAKIHPIFESEYQLPIATSDSSYTKNTSFSYTAGIGTTVNAKIRIQYSITRQQDRVTVEIKPIFTGVPESPGASIKFGVDSDTAEEEIFLYPFSEPNDGGPEVDTEKVSIDLDINRVSESVICKLYVDDEVCYLLQFRVYISPDYTGMDKIILNPFDRQVIRLTAPNNMILESYDIEPDDSIMYKCVFKYQGNIKLKNGAKTKNLDPAIPTVLQFNKSSGFWIEI